MLLFSDQIAPAIPGAILLRSYQHLVSMKTSSTQGMEETDPQGNVINNLN